MKQNKDIPQGYKDSPLGIIPQEWEVKEFGNIAKLLKEKYVPNQTEDLRCLELEHFGQGSGSILGWVKSSEQKSTKNKFKKGDVLFGKLRPYLQKYWHADFDGVCSSEVWVLNTNTKKCDLSFLYRTIQTNRFIQAANVSSGSKMPRADWDYVSTFPFLLPPLPEQQKIAEILTCWDTAIEKQTQLIEKLETRKRGLMQQLLTGKKRLKGFEEKWITVKLGEVGEISSAGVDKKSTEGELPIRLLNYLDVYRRDFLFSKEFNHRVTASADKIGKCSVKKGDIFFTPSSEVPNDIGISAIAMEDMPDVVYSYHVVRLRLHEDWDLKFRAYAFQTDMFYKQAETWCDGSGQRYVISQNNFRKIRINVPPIAEQTAIANILSTADEEIAKEKEKLGALKEQKRGLMQVLLTGKKRVKI